MIAVEVVMVTDQLRDDYDVVVAGGGAAGLGGALMLARSRRSVVVIDAGAPRGRGGRGSSGPDQRRAGRRGGRVRRGRLPGSVLGGLRGESLRTGDG